jgi:hypothetical protein
MHKVYHRSQIAGKDISRGGALPGDGGARGKPRPGRG